MAEEKKLTGKTYDIQAFTVQDGPGIRTTVFLKGCPLRCPWCHSPESQAFYDQLSFMSTKCAGIEDCGACLTACPKGAITPGKSITHPIKLTPVTQIHIDRKICDNCGECLDSCSYRAIYMCGEDWEVEDLVQRVLKDKDFYDISGGGVTISGGEALSQPQFTLAVLKRLKEEGVHTALDTTGFAKWETIEAVLPYVDLFLYDLKNMDDERHKALTAVSNVPILENALKIAENGGKMQVRVPVIPNFNDSKKNFTALGEFCKKLGDAVTVIQLLPYHNMGVMKYERLDQDKVILEAPVPTDEKIEELKQILVDMGLPVTVH